MNPLNPHDWFTKAERDLSLVNLAVSNSAAFPDLICYHCQQASEKYLKALIVYHGIPLKKTHDLEDLLDMLLVAEPGIDASYYNEAVKITSYAIGIRYPDPSGDPTPAQISEAITSAEFFRNFAKNVLGI